jgi:hypothetical protein
VLVSSVLLYAPRSADALSWKTPKRDDHAYFSGWSFALTGGVQRWDLRTVEDVLEARAADFATQGFDLPVPDFPWGPAFGLGISYHVSPDWLARVHAEWVTTTVSGRDAASFPELGGGVALVSLEYETEVRARVALVTLGVERTHLFRDTAIAWGAGAVFAPIRVRDRVVDHLRGEASEGDRETFATGWGIGLEVGATWEYLLDGGTSLFLEGFYRNGSARVTLDVPAFDGTLTPSEREVEFTGPGIRLGMGWN